MKTFPAVTGRDEFDALIIRTDYDDAQAWQAVTAALAEDDGEFDPQVHLVDDPAWAGAGVDEVLTAVTGDGNLSVFFIADRTTMRAEQHALLAVTTFTRDELDSDEDYDAHVEFGREFRTLPVGVHEIHANLQIANMDFEEFAEAAHNDPEGIYRSF